MWKMPKFPFAEISRRNVSSHFFTCRSDVPCGLGRYDSGHSKLVERTVRNYGKVRRTDLGRLRYVACLYSQQPACVLKTHLNGRRQGGTCTAGVPRTKTVRKVRSGRQRPRVSALVLPQDDVGYRHRRGHGSKAAVSRDDGAPVPNHIDGLIRTSAMQTWRRTVQVINRANSPGWRVNSTRAMHSWSHSPA